MRVPGGEKIRDLIRLRIKAHRSGLVHSYFKFIPLELPRQPTRGHCRKISNIELWCLRCRSLSLRCKTSRFFRFEIVLGIAENLWTAYIKSKNSNRVKFPISSGKVFNPSKQEQKSNLRFERLPMVLGSDATLYRYKNSRLVRLSMASGRGCSVVNFSSRYVKLEKPKIKSGKGASKT